MWNMFDQLMALNEKTTNVIKIPLLGTMNVCTEFHGNPSNYPVIQL